MEVGVGKEMEVLGEMVRVELPTLMKREHLLHGGDLTLGASLALRSQSGLVLWTLRAKIRVPTLRDLDGSAKVLTQ